MTARRAFALSTLLALRHEHGPGDTADEPHTHVHVHEPTTHRHPHYPEIHHRHRH